MNKTVAKWMVVLGMSSIVFGVGGGVAGGVAGYYVALSQQPAAVVTTGALPSATVKTTTVASVSATESSSVAAVAQQAEPAVVTIISTMQVQARRGSGTAVAEGSGVFIDAQGHILTNAHVVQGAQQLQVVYNDGSKVSAKLVGADTAADIAVIQVSGQVPAYLSLGDSSALQLGETVVAIGNPLGDYSGSVTAGVVSGLNRSVQGSGHSGLIQTDAAINHGNSGGPLLNLDGQIVGINTLAVQQSSDGQIAEGLGFAIPSNTVSNVVQQILGAAL